MFVSSIQKSQPPASSPKHHLAPTQPSDGKGSGLGMLGTEGLRCEIPSKINLFLEVLGRRADGYHDLDTVMHAIDLTDTLEIYPCDTSAIELRIDTSESQQIRTCHEHDSFHDRAFDIPSDGSNLIVRALESLRDALAPQGNRRLGARVFLRKRIPAQAGLGGGSADAAGALLLGSLLWSQRIDFPLIRSIAAQLGSDLNFFLDGHYGCHDFDSDPKLIDPPSNRIADHGVARRSTDSSQKQPGIQHDQTASRSWTARCTGRGERVEPLQTDLLLHGVIVHPREGCNTGAVFSRLRSDGALEGPRQTPDRLLELLPRLAVPQPSVLETSELRTTPTSANDWKVLGELLYNRLDEAAQKTTAWVQRAAIRLDRYNPHGQCLSGSGSARFCLCSSREQADEIAEELRKEGEYRAYSVSSWRTPALTRQIGRVSTSTE